jgi:hypothetical protein
MRESTNLAKRSTFLPAICSFCLIFWSRISSKQSLIGPEISVSGVPAQGLADGIELLSPTYEAREMHSRTVPFWRHLILPNY